MESVMPLLEHELSCRPAQRSPISVVQMAPASDFRLAPKPAQMPKNTVSTASSVVQSQCL